MKSRILLWAMEIIFIVIIMAVTFYLSEHVAPLMKKVEPNIAKYDYEVQMSSINNTIRIFSSYIVPILICGLVQWFVSKRVSRYKIVFFIRIIFPKNKNSKITFNKNKIEVIDLTILLLVANAIAHFSSEG